MFSDHDSQTRVSAERAWAQGVCRCGCNISLGGVEVSINGVNVTAEVTCGGIRFPDGVSLAPDLHDKAAAAAERHWLQMVAGAWRDKRAAKGARR